MGLIKVPLITELPFLIFQKIGRIVLWKDLTFSKLHFAETQVANVLDFISCLLHTENINRQEAYNGSKVYRGTQAKIYQNPPEGMTAKLVRNMTDSDLLDMHYFLTEDDDLDNDEFEEGFYIF